MTRDEAYRLAQNGYGAVGAYNSKPRAFVDMAVALGILKLDEPKSAIDRFCDAYHGIGCTRSCGPQIAKALQNAGLKIVEA